MDRDEFGMTSQDWEQVRREARKQDRIDRWNCLKALWLKPVTSTDYRGDTWKDASRGDDWQFWRAVKMTIGLVLNRRWSDAVEKARRAKYGVEAGQDMAFWDNHETYGGYSVMVGWLYPGCRVSLFSDGESFM